MIRDYDQRLARSRHYGEIYANLLDLSGSSRPASIWMNCSIYWSTLTRLDFEYEFKINFKEFQDAISDSARDQALSLSLQSAIRWKEFEKNAENVYICKRKT